MKIIILLGHCSMFIVLIELALHTEPVRNQLDFAMINIGHIRAFIMLRSLFQEYLEEIYN